VTCVWKKDSAIGLTHLTTQRNGSQIELPAEPSLKHTSMERNGSSAGNYQRIRTMVFADMAAKKDSASGHGPRV